VLQCTSSLPLTECYYPHRVLLPSQSVTTLTECYYPHRVLLPSQSVTTLFIVAHDPLQFSRPQAALIARKIKYRVLGGLSLTDKKEVRRSDSHSILPIHSAMMTVWLSMLRDTLRELQDMRQHDFPSYFCLSWCHQIKDTLAYLRLLINPADGESLK
jgi:hypothetical protein